MNLLDLGILGAFALFALMGWHNGFFLSMLNTGCFFLSWIASLIFSPLLARGIIANEGLANTMLFYTEGAELVHNIELRKLAVDSLSSQNMTDILTQSNLPVPLDNLVAQNMAGEVFQEQGIATVGDYFNQTIVNFTVNVLAFLIIFLAIRIIIGFVLKGTDYVVGFPMLKHFDGPIGAGFGIVRGFFAVFVIFSVVPTMLVVLPFEEIGQYIDDSFFGTFFMESNFLLSFIGGVI